MWVAGPYHYSTKFAVKQKCETHKAWECSLSITLRVMRFVHETIINRLRNTLNFLAKFAYQVEIYLF